MRVLVIGAQGQLGTEITKVYAGNKVIGADLDGDGLHIDIGDQQATHELITSKVKPDLLVNVAAAHNVPKCEENPEWSYLINAIAPRTMAIACRKIGARMIHVSTDYVFGNGGEQPFVETDLPAPLSVYAASKLAGEHLVAAEHPTNHITIRTAAIYGAAPCRAKGGKNFVNLMLDLAASRPEVKVVTDEYTTPTFTGDLAQQMKLLAEKAEPGLYHTTCQGGCSWYEFAQAIFEETRTETNLVKATASEFQTTVKRPNYSILENKHAQDQGLDIMPPWREALKAYLATH